jgi:hypothetical protein
VIPSSHGANQIAKEISLLLISSTSRLHSQVQYLPLQHYELVSIPLLSLLSAASTASAVGSSGTSTITPGSFDRLASIAARFCTSVNIPHPREKKRGMPGEPTSLPNCPAPFPPSLRNSASTSSSAGLSTRLPSISRRFDACSCGLVGSPSSSTGCAFIAGTDVSIGGACVMVGEDGLAGNVAVRDTGDTGVSLVGMGSVIAVVWGGSKSAA